MNRGKIGAWTQKICLVVSVRCEDFAAVEAVRVVVVGDFIAGGHWVGFGASHQRARI